MAIRRQNGFATQRVSLPIVTDLGLVKKETALGYYKAYSWLAKDSIVAELEASGAVERTGQEEFGMYFQNAKNRNRFKVTADATVENSGEVTVTIQTYADSGETLSAPEVGLFFVDNSTGVEFEVISVNKSAKGAHTAVIKPTVSGVDTEITSADSEFISVGRPSVKEASEQQAGEHKAWDKRYNNIRIIRTNKGWTDLTTMTNIVVTGEDGTTYYDLDRSELPKEHIDVKEMELITGIERDNVTSEGNRNSKGVGLVPLVQEYGTLIDGGGAGAVLDKALFRNISRSIKGDGLSESYRGIADTEAMFQIQDFLQANGLQTQVVVSPQAQELKALFDYSTDFKIDGITYTFKDYSYWNARRLADADPTKSYLSNHFLLIPNGGGQNGEGKYQPYLQLRVMDNNIPQDEGYFNKVDYDGALFGQGTTRAGEISYTSYMGIDVMGVEGFVDVKLAPAQ